MFCGKYERNECTLCPLLPSYEQVVRIMIMKMLIPMIIYDNDNNNYYYHNNEDSDDDDNHNNLKLQSPLLDIIGSHWLPVSSHN